MKLVQPLILFCLVMSSSQAREYDCSRADAYAEEEALKLIYPMVSVQICNLIGGITGMIINLFILNIFYFYPNSRKPPANLIIAICFSGFVDSLHYFLSEVFVIMYNELPRDSSTFCQITGVFGTYGANALLIYNGLFTLSPNIIVISSLKDKWKKFIIISQFLVTALLFFFILYALLESRIGNSLQGDCYFIGFPQAYAFPILTLVLNVLFVVSGIYSIQNFRFVVPKNAFTRDKRGPYLTYFKTYFISISIATLLSSLFDTILQMLCLSSQLEHQQWLIMLTAVLSQIPCSVCPFVLLYDPRIKSEIPKLKRCMKKIENRIKSFSLTRKSSDVLTELTFTVKTQQIYSCLAGVLLMDKKLNENKVEFIDIPQRQSSPDLVRQIIMDIVSLEFDEKVLGRQSLISEQFFNFDDGCKMGQIQISEDDAVENLNSILDMTTLEMRVCLIAPKIFQTLQKVDFPLVNIQESLDLSKVPIIVIQQNRKQILNISGPDGGKSGEFFFFSWDHKLILKTLGKQELDAITNRIVTYGNYLYNNPNSLIAKIYGIYIFQRLIDNQPFGPKTHLLLMRNISLGIPKNFIQRTYDLKGSEYDREVLVKSQAADLRKVTLKDIDFAKIETKIWIPQDIKSEINGILKKDAHFFRITQLIDYSLLILKVDWQAYTSSTGITYESVVNELPSQFYVIKSSAEEGICYQMAIIDYLQEWNVQKVMEQQTKKIINLNASLDTSAQNPQTYATRFTEKLVDNLFNLDE